jgi:hypothetical protein
MLSRSLDVHFAEIFPDHLAGVRGVVHTHGALSSQ